jgi:ferrous iron transport protein B
LGTIDFKDIVHNNVLQRRDAALRYSKIQKFLGLPDSQKVNRESDARLDKILVHPIWGYGLILLLLLIIFQVVYHVATVPMEIIDNGFG